MRLGTVIGRVTLAQQEPAYQGGRLLLVQPWSREQLARAHPPLPPARGDTVVVYDELGAGDGTVVGFVEGPEAAQPFGREAPVDAYAACIVEHVDYRPPPGTS